MIATIDVSMYPNREEFIPPIDGFIERINTYEGLEVTTFPTSTVVQGEFGLAMRAVQETMAYCRSEWGMAVFVLKVIPGYEAL